MWKCKNCGCVFFDMKEIYTNWVDDIKFDAEGNEVGCGISRSQHERQVSCQRCDSTSNNISVIAVWEGEWRRS